MVYNSVCSVLVGIGVEMMMEVIWAASILRQRCPQLRVRVVNVTDLMILATSALHPHGLSLESFEGLFTKDKCIHFNYVRLASRKLYQVAADCL